MKKYKNYIIATGILILGIIIGNIVSKNDNKTTNKNEQHHYVQDPVTKLWTCVMHPQIKLKKPGKCPICGMTLVPLKTENSIKETTSSNEVIFTPEAIKLAEIQTSMVTKIKAIKEINLLGIVKPDERKLYSQVSHLPGRIEKLYVNFTGEKVYKGQKIMSLYSPELITAQKELFEAIRSKKIYPRLYEATVNKLKLWKLHDTQIRDIEKSGKVHENIDILSDYTGYVTKLNVELGNHVKAGSSLFKITNLNKVWLMFEAYEQNLPWIHINNKIKFSVTALPGQNFTGKITYISPFIDKDTRIAKIRVEFNNKNHKLLPEMFVNGVVNAKLSNANKVIVIPKSAVLWTGKRSIVYVKVPHKNITSFLYREVTLGSDLGDFYIIKKGLKIGEFVATNGVFRIDAAAQLKGKKSMMNASGSKNAAKKMMNMPMMKNKSDKNMKMTKN